MTRPRPTHIATEGCLAVVAAAVLMTSANAAQRNVFEDPGVIKIMEGEECASRPGDSRDFPFPIDFDPSIRPAPYLHFPTQSWPVPSYADQAIVFLNGFRATYTSKDHHLGSVGALTGASAIVRSPANNQRLLNWSLGRPQTSNTATGTFMLGNLAGVELADKGADDAVEGCYFFTAVAWNSNVIRASVVTDGAVDAQSDGDSTIGSVRWRYSNDGVVAVAAPTAYLMEDGNSSDRHALQIAYRLLQDNPNSARQVVRAQALMKDNKVKSPIRFSTDIVLIGGPDVSIIEDQFPLEPVNNVCKKLFGGCIGAEPKPSFSELQTERRSNVVDSPVEYIIPILTAFDLESNGDDDHVKHVGAWLTGLRYPNNGRDVRYTVNTVLQDKGGSRFNKRTRVSYLEFKRPPPRIKRPPIGAVDDDAGSLVIE